MNRCVVLTGAGLSAESGLGTFRDADGIWTEHDLNEVATPEGFARDPAKVHEFYNARRAQMTSADPNAAHFALAQLQARHPDTLLITQNIDNLLERAGAKHVVHMHGELERAKCARCNHSWKAATPLSEKATCPSCARPAVRPDVVWFGEMPYQMERIAAALQTCDMFVSIGTSGTVYPAAEFVAEAARNGAHTLEINLNVTNRTAFHEYRTGPATKVVPYWVGEFLEAAVAA